MLKIPMGGFVRNGYRMLLFLLFFASISEARGSITGAHFSACFSEVCVDVKADQSFESLRYASNSPSKRITTRISLSSLP